MKEESISTAPPTLPPAWSRNPAVLGGELVFANTRVPVRSLFDHLEGGDSLDDFLEGFPSVTRDQAVAVLEECWQRTADEHYAR
jgi:uncharacterized protein (DUF433 family)